MVGGGCVPRRQMTRLGPSMVLAEARPQAAVSAAGSVPRSLCRAQRRSLPAFSARPAGRSSSAFENLCQDHKTVSHEPHSPGLTLLPSQHLATCHFGSTFCDRCLGISFLPHRSAGQGLWGVARGMMGPFLFPPTHFLQLLVTQPSSPRLATATSHSM